MYEILRINACNIETSQKIIKQKPDTVYITEYGLYNLLIRSRMGNAKKIQTWLINNAFIE